MRTRIALGIACLLSIFCLLSAGGCGPETAVEPESPQPVAPPAEISADYPKIASWLVKKDEIIAAGKPYDLVMSGWFTPEESSMIKSVNPDAVILAGLSVNWVWNNRDWMDFLLAVAGYGRETPFVIDEAMYLHRPDGHRCTFGWASEEWGHEEIYAMDPRNTGWAELITAFYRNVLEQPQHDGIIIDMVLEKSWCPDAISDDGWVEATRAIMAGIAELNTADKMVILNAGRDITDIDAYGDFMNGYLMENFMGEQMRSTFDEGLEAADSGYIVIYAVDTDDTGEKDPDRMRLGLTLSLLNDNTCFTYDFGPRDHGQSWWFAEYDIDLGMPLGAYFEEGNSYRRRFENGTVVCAPYDDVQVSFDGMHTDATTGQESEEFTVAGGDGRIFLRRP